MNNPQYLISNSQYMPSRLVHKLNEYKSSNYRVWLEITSKIEEPVVMFVYRNIRVSVNRYFGEVGV